MTFAALMVIAFIVDAIVNSELTNRTERCGHTADGFVCLLPKNHEGEHD